MPNVTSNNTQVPSWNPVSEKPETHDVILLSIWCGNVITGQYNPLTGQWFGYDARQAHPLYELNEGLIQHWMYIPAVPSSR